MKVKNSPKILIRKKLFKMKKTFDVCLIKPNISFRNMLFPLCCYLLLLNVVCNIEATYTFLILDCVEAEKPEFAIILHNHSS